MKNQKSSHSRSGNGKIARLPKSIRDQINNSILDGVPYTKIIRQLGDHGKGLTPSNLSKYREFSFQSWLREKNWRDDLRARQESFTDLLRGNDATQLPEAALQMTATQMCELLHDLNPTYSRSEIENDPDKYVRLVNALARISRTLIDLQRYRDTQANERTQQLKQLDPNRDLDKEHDLLVAAMERGFGIKAALGPIAPAFYDRFDTPVPTVPSQEAPQPQADLPETLLEDAQLQTLPIGNPGEPPFVCTECANCPPSFSVRPLPRECELCPICPVKPKTS